LVFATNVFLPWHIGLGKGASTGFGVLYPVRKQDNPTTIAEDEQLLLFAN
jgi:hypothetical protein